MNFGNKLKLVLDIFCLKSRKLAITLHIDPSSVSRWLNNKRVPNPNSEIIEKLADYFFSIEAFEYQKERFLKLILPKDNLDVTKPEHLKRIFKEWLYLDSDEPQRMGPHSSDQHEVHINRFLSNIVNGPTNAILQLPQIQVNSQMPFNPAKGELKETEVFYGFEGMRQALLLLAAYLLISDKPGELLITAQDFSFMYSDFESHMFLINKLKEILLKGHKIKFIFNLNLSLPELMNMIKNLLILYSYGDIETFYFQKYAESTIGTAFFVVPEYGAAYAVMPGDKNIKSCTFLYRSCGIIEFFKNNFEILLQNTSPLIFTFMKHNIHALQDNISKMEEATGSRYVYKNSLTSLTIPPSLYKKLMDKTTLSDEEKQNRLSLHKLRLEILKSGTSLYKDVCTLDALEKMTGSEGYEYVLIDVFSSGVLKADPQDVLEHLKNTVQTLQECHNFELYLTSEEIIESKTMYFAVKEDNSVIISTWNNQGIPYSIIIRENTVVNAFEEYFKNIFNQIPALYKSKEWVISKLQTKIERLEKYLNC